MHARPLHALFARPVEWLWPGRLALGKLTLLDGDPGLGKSLVLLDLAARLSRGRPWPDAAAAPEPANTLVVAAEDNDADTVAPRLHALGADPARVFVWDSTGPLPRLPGDVAALDSAVAEAGARLLVIDPLLALVDRSVNVAGDDSVRRLLAPLAELAERRRCAVALVRHLNKQAAGRALYRGAGSVAFVAACRLALLCARDPADAERRVLAPLKSNLAAPAAPLAFRPVPADPAPPTLEWLPGRPLSADDLLRPRRAGAAPSRDRAAKFLLEFLRQGPRLSAEAQAEASERGISRRTLKRVMRELDVQYEHVAHRGHAVTFWMLKGHRVPEQGGAWLDRLLLSEDARFVEQGVAEEEPREAL